MVLFSLIYFWCLWTSSWKLLFVCRLQLRKSIIQCRSFLSKLVSKIVRSQKLNQQNRENWDGLEKFSCNVNVINVALTRVGIHSIYWNWLPSHFTHSSESAIFVFVIVIILNCFWVNVIIAFWKWFESISQSPWVTLKNCIRNSTRSFQSLVITFMDNLWHFRLIEKWRSVNKQTDIRMYQLQYLMNNLISWSHAQNIYYIH